jgi:hypothetical protein
MAVAIIGEAMSNSFTHSTAVVSQPRKRVVDEWLLLSIPIATLSLAALSIVGSMITRGYPDVVPQIALCGAVFVVGFGLLAGT